MVWEDTDYKQATDFIGLDKFEGYTQPTLSVRFDRFEGTQLLLLDWEDFRITQDSEPVVGLRLRFQEAPDGPMLTTVTYSEVVRSQLETIGKDELPFLMTPVAKGSGQNRYITISN